MVGGFGFYIIFMDLNFKKNDSEISRDMDN
jgi:hypothetical protein